MKKNGNNNVMSDYYIGLDLGTESVGWAVSDMNYNLLRAKGKDMWGVRLFDEAETKQARRLNRTNRRRLARQKWRLQLLRELFDEEICKIDKNFFMRMKNSALIGSDKNMDTKFILFADSNYTDKNYFTDEITKTAYHLRKELIHNPSPHDIRLVYLALYHIIKSRGHFLYSLDDDGEEQTFEQVLTQFKETVESDLGLAIEISDIDSVKEILCDDKLGKKEKSERLKSLFKSNGESELDKTVQKNLITALIKLIVGMTVNIKDIYVFGECEKDSFCVTDAEDKIQECLDKYEDISEVLLKGKAVYDKAVCERILKGNDYLCEYKVSQYKQHADDIRLLKEYVRNVLCDAELYKEIFVYKAVKVADKNGKEKEVGLKNYAAYSRYKKGDEKTGKTTSEEFCAFLKEKLGKIKEGADEKYFVMWQHIEDGTFAPKLRTSENGCIPNSMHKKELIKILENASSYLPFLNDKDENGLSVVNKIISIFDYKLPYYVGPIGKNSQYGWAVRNKGMEDEKIYPWNWSSIIDERESSRKFIERMKSLCTYTGDNVIARDSLLYSEFAVLNEINNLKLNGNPIDVDAKKLIYQRLYIEKNRKVRLKDIKDLLISEGYAQKGDEISGTDETLNATLSSYHKMKRILAKTSPATVEAIIEHVVLFGDAKNILRSWLKENVPQLCEDDVKYVLSLKFKNWGNLSKRFLTEIYDVDRIDGTGELVSIIDMMRNHNVNLMQLLSGNYEYAKKAREYKLKKSGVASNPLKMIDELYVSPKIRRSIWQALRIVDEIVDVMKSKPRKIFVEVPRENDPSKKNKRTTSRKQQLLDLYQNCKKQSKELLKFIDGDEFKKLQASVDSMSDDKLRAKKLYLYYRQFGKCMYSGESIDLNELYDQNRWDLDHIYPRSKIKDDSLDNLVLVKAELNREKSNTYPIGDGIRNNMYSYWKFLLNAGCISKTKFERLTRSSELTDDELSAFINRQLVETGQSTKAVAEILNTIYGESGNGSKIVYSKAANVSEFRQHFDMLKCRDINDFHHAHDAYLNIVVGNYFDTRFTSDFMRHLKDKEYSLKPEALYKYYVRGAWNAKDDETINVVRKTMSKNSVLYTQMPLEEKGQLFNLNPVKKDDELIPLKKDRKTAIYGGYNSAKGAYWAIVEYQKQTKRGVEKRIAIEAVLIYQKTEYEKDPLAYAQTYWAKDGEIAKIRVNKILYKTLFEIDGARLLISGRTGNQIIFVIANQLLFNYETTKYLRKVLKIAEIYRERKKEISEYELSDVNSEDNINLYDLFIQKCKSNVYAKAFGKVYTNLINCRERFVSISIAEQCKMLSEVIKAFECKAIYAKLKEFGGSTDQVGLIRLNKTFGGKISIIYQSITGLYEKKIVIE
ncbi:MAG: type II CRISPR RNA-guided endonuclease Cas9 [Bacteroides sp.]|nr:type II CRISPR RNA-guided endonuclease Cas9 [Bacillota bacterium]MCM1455548.1 type II CRISPR RNA-guided endonuclease Cas9 [Bacteroides sp.]